MKFNRLFGVLSPVLAVGSLESGCKDAARSMRHPETALHPSAAVVASAVAMPARSLEPIDSQRHGASRHRAPLRSPEDAARCSYTMPQLINWKVDLVQGMRATGNVRWLYGIGIDEKRNVINVGVADRAAVRRVSRIATRLRIPANAVMVAVVPEEQDFTKN